MSDVTNRQFALLLISHARLSPDTMNSLLLQLTLVSGAPEEADRTDIILIGEKLKVLNTMLREGTPGDKITRKKILNKMKNVADSMEGKRNYPTAMFKVGNEMHYLSQVVDAPMKEHKEILGKRIGLGDDERSDFVKRLKEENAFRVCKQL